MYRRAIIYVSFLLILAFAGLVIGVDLLRVPKEAGEEEEHPDGRFLITLLKNRHE